MSAIGKKYGVALGLILLAAAGLRMWTSWNCFASDFDTSTVGLMALHILEGERPLFFYGQSYMGALEAYLAAILFALFKPGVFILSLSPILFSLAWIAATAGVFRQLLGDRAALAAALVAAFPGWQGLWYSIGSYGGYPGAFFFGTAGLWLALRLVRQTLGRRGVWLHFMLLGLVAGLGLWTNYQSAAFFVTAGLLLAYFAVRRGQIRAWLGPGLAALPCFLMGFWPQVLAIFRAGGGEEAAWEPAWSVIRHSFAVFVNRHLAGILFWPGQDLVSKTILLVLLAAGLAWALALAIRQFRTEGAGWAALPLLFCAVFMALYLPHRLAATGATRYLIPWMTLLAAFAFAVPAGLATGRGRWLAGGLLLGWMLVNTTQAAHQINIRREGTRARIANDRRIAEKAVSEGLRHVFMVGGIIYGHEGQTLSLQAQARTHFVSVTEERHGPSSQAADADDQPGFLYERVHARRMENTLRRLEAQSDQAPLGRSSLLWNVRFQPDAARAVTVSGVTVAGPAQGPADAVTDRVQDTTMNGPVGEGTEIILDLGTVRTVCGMILLDRDILQTALPESSRILVSADGEVYRTAYENSGAFAVAGRVGAGVFFKGYFGCQEIRFAPVAARFVKVIPLRLQQKQQEWSIAELFVLEPGAPSDPKMDLDRWARELTGLNLDFVVADRWLSARLAVRFQAAGCATRVFPRYNPKFQATLISRRFHPEPGRGLLVAQAFADDCERLIREVHGEGLEIQRQDGSHYVLFLFGGLPTEQNGLPLDWNGFTLLRGTEP